MSITKNYFLTITTLLAVAFGIMFVAAPAYANHSGGDELEASHSTTAHHDDDDVDAAVVTAGLVSGATKEAQMKALIELLTKMIALLQQQIKEGGVHMDDNDAMHDDDDEDMHDDDDEDMHDDDDDMDDDEDEDHDDDDDHDDDEDDDSDDDDHDDE